MRRLAVLCAVAVMMVAALAMVGGKHGVTVSAANASGNLVLFVNVAGPGGCPLGPAYVFCDQVPGTTGLPGGFTISSSAAVSGVSVSFQQIPGLSANFTPGDFTIELNSCTGNLSAGQQCEIGVAFSPTTTGLRAAELTVTDAGGDTLAIAVEGTGKNLALASPIFSCTVPNDNAFTYCNEPVGSASAPGNFTLAAGTGGATSINVSLAAIPGLQSEFTTGSTQDFTITSNGCTGALGAGASCAIGVEFTPQATGLRSAALTATDANGDSTTVYLAGSATSGVALHITESNPAACARLNFFGYCSEPVGGTSVTTSLMLVNTSGTQITGLAMNPPMPTTPPKMPAPPPTNFTVENTSCTTMLPANSSCTIDVAFTPQTTGLLQGEISVTDDQGDVAGVNLAGTGDDYSLQLASGQSEEVTVAQGGSATFKAMVVPDSVFGQNGEMVKFQCPSNLPGFATCAFSPCPAAITPGAAVAFSVTFVTSSATSAAPTVASCGGSSGVGPGVTRNPTMILRAAPERGALPVSSRFPALWGLALGAIALAIFAGGTVASRMWRMRGARTGKPVRQTAGASSRTPHEAPVGAGRTGSITPSKFAGHSMLCPYEETAGGAVASRMWRVRYIFAVAGLAVALMIGCHGSKTISTTPPPTTPVTPTGSTSMTILGNATDASGNPLGTSRSLQVTLDVVKH